MPVDDKTRRLLDGVKSLALFFRNKRHTGEEIDALVKLGTDALELGLDAPDAARAAYDSEIGQNILRRKDVPKKPAVGGRPASDSIATAL